MIGSCTKDHKACDSCDVFCRVEKRYHTWKNDRCLYFDASNDNKATEESK